MFRQSVSSSLRALRPALRTAPPSTFLRTQISAPAPATLRLAVWRGGVSRWYSTEGESKDQAKDTTDTSGSSSSSDAKDAASGVSESEAALKKQLEAKEKEALDWKDKCLRSVADFRNLQDRTQREMKSARDFAIQKFAKDLIDSVDNLDRALSMVPQEKLKSEEKNEHLQDLSNLHEGLKMTETILMQTLQKHGLERFDPAGEKFNPNEHEATFMTPQEGKEDNTVFFVQQKGFKLNGRVLRAAKVGVVKNN